MAGTRRAASLDAPLIAEAPPPPRSRSREGRRSGALFAGAALVVAGVLPGFLVASLATRLGRDFPFGAADLGLAVAIFYAVSALGSTPAGRLVDRGGPVLGVRLSATLSGSACLAIAALVESTTALVPLLVVAGVGNALSGPAASALFRREIEMERHGFAFGVLQAGGPIGALFAGLALPVVAIPFGWRWAFAAAAALALGAALGAGRRRRLSRPAARVDGPSAPGAPVASTRRDVRVLGVVAALASGAAMGMVSFLVLYGVANGLSEAAAGALLAAVSLAAAIGRVVVGAVADRRHADPSATVARLLAISIIGYALLATGGPAAIVLGAMLVGAAGWTWPGALTLAVVRRSPDAPAWAVGVMMTGLFIGAMAGPFVVGLIVDRGQFTWPWVVCAIVAGIGAASAASTLRDARAEAR
jgi:MFS family permease